MTRERLLFSCCCCLLYCYLIDYDILRIVCNVTKRILSVKRKTRYEVSQPKESTSNVNEKLHANQVPSMDKLNQRLQRAYIQNKAIIFRCVLFSSVSRSSCLTEYIRNISLWTCVSSVCAMWIPSWISFRHFITHWNSSSVARIGWLTFAWFTCFAREEAQSLSFHAYAVYFGSRSLTCPILSTIFSVADAHFYVIVVVTDNRHDVLLFGVDFSLNSAQFAMHTSKLRGEEGGSLLSPFQKRQEKEERNRIEIRTIRNGSWKTESKSEGESKHWWHKMRRMLIFYPCRFPI